MTDTLNSPVVKNVLTELFQKAEANDSVVLANLDADIERRGGVENDGDLADLLGKAYISVSPEMGRLLYIIARNGKSRNIVEFGTSFGISTIHLAAAVRDNGGGKIITTELTAEKIRQAEKGFAAAGVADLIEIRQGDALETLKEIDFEIDFLLLDGWKNLYLPVLQLLEPKLKEGALVVADDLDIFPEAHEPYLDYVRQPGNGYESVEIPLGDKIELSIHTGK